MIFDISSSAMLNHLWQSTLVVGLAALLALVLQRNQARTRYWLWVAASVKFVVPFSLLIAAGGYLRGWHEAAPMARPAVSAVLQEVTQPFSQTSFVSGGVLSTVAHTPIAQYHENLWPMALLVLWACGALMVAFSWWRKWRAVQATVRAATPLEPIGDLRVMSSPALLEPGVFGIFRPVLLLPEGITERLTAPQLSAIVAHEKCHVRRRDNLMAALHMVTETIFWFHPGVWWVGARLVEERERACDEAVLQSGNEAEVYAEGILNVCKLYVESPLACVSGVTGADLKKRIVRIVTEQVVHPLDLRRKLLLGVAALVAVTVPVAFGLVQATSPQTPPPVAKQNTGTASAATTGLAGTWQGTLHLGQDLRTVVKITKKADGSGYSADFYSIDQIPRPIPVKDVTLQGSTVKFAIEMIDGSYTGKLSGDGNSIAGTWTQGDHSTPLNLVRATPATEWTIPTAPPPMKPMAADAKPSFEVATIKPSKPGQPGKMFTVRGRNVMTINTTAVDLIELAYGVQGKQIIGGPDWLKADRWDISGPPDQEGQPSVAQMKGMVAKLLADRFKLTFHHEQRPLAVYLLEPAKDGPKLEKSTADPKGLPGLFFSKPGILHVRNATMEEFSRVMQSGALDRPVVDKTGLDGKYDFTLKWTPDESQFQEMGFKITPPADPANAPPGLFTAIQQELGLKLDATKAPVDVLVIDHVEKPSAN